MSYTEALHPGEDTRQAEMGKTWWIEADGTKIGWETRISDLDNLDKKGDKWKDAPISTVAEMWAKQAASNAALEQFAQENPDARPAVETPKSAAKTQETLDKGMNAVYP